MTLRKELLAALASTAMVVAIASCGVPDPHSGGTPSLKPNSNNPPATTPTNDPDPTMNPTTNPPPDTTPPPDTNPAPVANDFSISTSQASATAAVGGSATFMISSVVVSGNPESIVLSVSGLPAKLTASLNPATIAAGQNATLTIAVSADAPAGTATFTVKGASPSVEHSTSASLTVTTNMPPPPPPPPPPMNCALADQAKMLFTTGVQPIVSPTTMCGNGICHGGQGSPQPQFISMTRPYETLTSYALVVGTFDKNTAPILTKIAGGTHFAMVYTPAQVTTIGTWLDAEKTARAMCTTTTSTIPTPGQVLDLTVGKWSGCMEQTTFDQNGVATAVAGLVSTQGPCIRCHEQGAYDMEASDDSTRTFNALTQNAPLLKVWFAFDVTNLNAPKVTVNDALFIKVTTGQPPFIEHPLATWQGSQAQTKLKAFFTATQAKMNATPNTCGASKIISPP